MTTRTVTLPTAPAGLFALASVIDIAFLAAIGSKDAAPLPVILLFALLGLVTLAALVPARRGSRPALIIAVAAAQHLGPARVRLVLRRRAESG